MAEIELLDRGFHYIMRRIVDTGQAPHYTETATGLGLSMEEGRQLYHDLVDGQYHSAWLYPDTEYIVSFAPFQNLPTQHRITVDGEQKWFAQ